MNATMITRSKIIPIAIVILISLAILTTITQPVYAGDQSLTESLKDATSSGGEDIIQKVDEGGYKAVNTIRSVAIVAAVIFLVWAGIIFWGAGGNPAKISEAKSKLIWFFVALVFIFMAENIFATLADFFGIKLE